MKIETLEQVLCGGVSSGKKMKDLEWKDEYLLGIPEIDLQHKRIFDCIATIAEEGLTKEDRWRADSSIVQLVGLLQEHFALEESLMRILGYPELERHIEEHRHFNAEVHDLAQKSLRIIGSVSHEMIMAVQKWQREHIMQSDRHYVDYFSGSVRHGGRRSIDRIRPRMG